MSKMSFRCVLVAISFVAGRCGIPVAQTVREEPTSYHVNPEFECPTTRVVEPHEGYPHPIRQLPFSPEPERSVAQLEEFCARMMARFANARLPLAEAQRVYSEIPKVLTITDGSYGTPDPDAPLPPPVDLPTRVMLRKIGEDRYELFYFTIECGRNYRHLELTLAQPDPVLRPLETWSETFPC